MVMRDNKRWVEKGLENKDHELGKVSAMKVKRLA